MCFCSELQPHKCRTQRSKEPHTAGSQIPSSGALAVHTALKCVGREPSTLGLQRTHTPPAWLALAHFQNCLLGSFPDRSISMRWSGDLVGKQLVVAMVRSEMRACVLRLWTGRRRAGSGHGVLNDTCHIVVSACLCVACTCARGWMCVRQVKKLN